MSAVTGKITPPASRPPALWPALPLAEWQETCDTLHMWTQIVGKTRMALTPPLNHWWSVALYVSSRGLTTSPIPYGERIFEIEFDFIQHQLFIRTDAGEQQAIRLYPRSVADFYREFMSCMRALSLDAPIHTMPAEFSDPIPFEKDERHAAYDREYVERFWRILVNVDSVLKEFRSRFVGKASPVHFFWGSFDMAATRFSGRPAPQKKEVDAITREAYSHEVSSCGFWPGDARYKFPAFYAYAAPAPAAFAQARVRPAQAFFSAELGEFLLNYDDVRTAPAPEEALLDFCQSTYEAAAELGQWDRKALERAA